MKRLGIAPLVLALFGAAVLPGCSAGLGIGGGEARRATPGALVAVALAHLDYQEKDISSIKSENIRYGYPPRTIGASINFRGPDSVTVTVGPSQPVRPCPFPQHCVEQQDASGTTQITWDLEEPEEDPGFVAVVRYTDDEVRRVVLSGPHITKDPRRMDLPRVGGVDGMRDLVEDPAFAWTTTRGALDAAEKLQRWSGKNEKGADPGPLRDWTPRMLGGLASNRLWYLSRVGAATAPEPAGPTGKATGIRFNGDHIGAATSIYLLPDPPDGATTCPVGYTCTTEGSVTYAWASGRAAIFRERDGFVLRIYYIDSGLDAPGRDSFSSGDLEQLVRFSADPAIGTRMSSDWAHVERLSWEGE